MKEGLKLRGEVLIERRAKDGKVLDREVIKNLIVNSGKQAIAQGTGLTAFSYIGIGTDNTGALATDTELGTQVARESCQSGSPAYEADYKATFEKTFTFGSGESYSIVEAGLFDASGSGGTMFDRLTFTAKSVDADTDLYVKITVTVS